MSSVSKPWEFQFTWAFSSLQMSRTIKANGRAIQHGIVNGTLHETCEFLGFTETAGMWRPGREHVLHFLR